MCGISGYLHFDKARTADRALLKRMTDTLIHRGPDGEGQTVDGPLGLGHRRLSIIDLNTGDQPMTSEEDSVIISFNGEIYNYIELREELQSKGHQFKTQSDTEVLIKAYKEWGSAFQEKLNGMWAFAIWDKVQESLLLSRDRVGEKPLYFSTYDNSLIFGSEIKALLAYGIPKEANMEVAELYLHLSYVPAPYTFYKNIQQLLPGQCLIFKDGKQSLHQHWKFPELEESSMNQNKHEVYQRFEELLEDSVRIRMRSDVSFGAFLSGGMDSASIVALMSRHSKLPIKTYTMGFEEEEFDERDLAKLVSEQYHTEHHEAIVNADSFQNNLDLVHKHYDDPFGDSSAIPTSYVSKFASEHVKMVLTGDGGDEVLSGYQMYQGEKATQRFSRLPSFIKKAAPLGINLVRPFVGQAKSYRLSKISNVLQTSDQDFLTRSVQKFSWMNSSVVKSLTASYKTISIEDYFTDLLKGCNYSDPFYKLMYLDYVLRLPNDMLTKVDRMSMAYSLETRTPFLDYRLIEFMCGVHKDVKMQGFERKSVLKHAMGAHLPSALMSAPKKGFAVPVREWFKSNQFDTELQSLASDDFGLNASDIQTIINQNKKGTADHGNFIWMLMVLKSWMDS